MDLSAKKTGRARKPSNKQEQILAVATTCFLSYGYDGSSISKMARDSGISKESVYRYFTSKQHLFRAVIDQELAQYHQEIKNLTADTNPANARESLLTIAGTLLSLSMSDRQQAVRRLIFNEIRRFPEIGRYYFKIGSELAYENLEKFFASMQEKTEFSVADLSRIFVALLLHDLLLQRSCSVRECPSADEIVELVQPIVADFLKTYFKL